MQLYTCSLTYKLSKLSKKVKLVAKSSQNLAKVLKIQNLKINSATILPIFD